LKSDINNGRPVYYIGCDTTGVDNGHAWVVDGYNYSNEFHCNWGWGGSYNDWYSLAALNPYPGLSLNTWQGAISSARPILDACSGLIGDDEVCASSNETYYVTVPSAASVVWSKTAVFNQVGGNTGSAYTVSYASNGGGTITATIKNSQGQTFLTRSKDVWAGKPHDLDGVYCEGGEGGPIEYSYPLWVSPVYYNYNDIIAWGVSPSADITDLGGGYASIHFNSPGNYTIWAYTTNECDDGDYAYTYFYAYDYDFLLSPNPATDEVEIIINDGLTEKSKSSSFSEVYMVTVTDINGITKSQKEYNARQFTISVQNLKNGNYLVNVSNDKMNKTKQLIIKQ
jgi:hypothetical protein